MRYGDGIAEIQFYSNTFSEPPVGKCNYFIKDDNSTVIIKLGNNYGGIPQNLIINVTGKLRILSNAEGNAHI